VFSDLIPEFREFATALVQAAGSAGLQPRVTSTLRTHSQQKRLYERYLAGGSPYPALPPGRSAHEFGYAFDMVVTPMQALADVGYTWQDWGGVWGGARDPVHFEYPGFVPPEPDTTVKSISFWDYAGWALDFTSLASLLLELGYTVASREEAEKIARALHIDPQGRIF